MASNEFLSSKVVISEEPGRSRSVIGLPTAVMSMVGLAERGRFEPYLATTFEQWFKEFGGYTLDARDTVGAVQGYFEEGGQYLWFQRTAHYTDILDADTLTADIATVTAQTGPTSASAGSVLSTNAAPFNLEPGDTLTASVGGGANQTATFTAVAATRTAGATGPYVLSNGQQLTVAIDGGSVQTVTFLTGQFVNIAAATATEVAAVLNAALVGAHADVNANAPRITSDRRGTGSGVNVTGGTANTALTYTTGNVAGSGNVSNIDAVTASEVETVLEAAWTNNSGVAVTNESGFIRVSTVATGGSASILVVASSTADDELGFDNATHSGGSGSAADTLRIDGKTAGAYANDIRVFVEAATSGDAARFNVRVEDNGVIVERFPNLTMDDADPRFAETVINHAQTGSNLIAVVDLDLGGVDGSAASQRPANGTYALAGGDDGLTGLADVDFIGSSVSRTGIRAFDTITDITLMSIPQRATSAVQNAMITYAETTRNRSIFVVLDPPAALEPVEILDYVENTAALSESTEFAAMYWPRLKVVNPNATLFGANGDDGDGNIVVPVSGHIAGMISRKDGSRPGGVYLSPAGPEGGVLRSITGFENDAVLDEAVRDLLFPRRINPITTMRGQPRYVDGARGLSSGGNWPYVGQRRGVIFIEQTLRRALQFARGQNITEELLARCERTAEQFLLNQLNVGAFASKDPELAFFVDAGKGLNPPFSNVITIRVGLAMAVPGEFIHLIFVPNDAALELSLSA